MGPFVRVDVILANAMGYEQLDGAGARLREVSFRWKMQPRGARTFSVSSEGSTSCGVWSHLGEGTAHQTGCQAFAELRSGRLLPCSDRNFCGVPWKLDCLGLWQGTL